MRVRLTLSILAMTAVCGQFVTAQPPERRDGPPPERRDGLRDALDTNGDHELDADEMKNATANLAKADRNGDGKIDHEEFRPPLPPIPRGEGGFRGPPPARESGSERGPVRDGAFRGEGGPRPEGGPSPERFVERAMAFDADGRRNDAAAPRWHGRAWHWSCRRARRWVSTWRRPASSSRHC
jgi:hypothetical protein